MVLIFSKGTSVFINMTTTLLLQELQRQNVPSLMIYQSRQIVKRPRLGFPIFFLKIVEGEDWCIPFLSSQYRKLIRLVLNCNFITDVILIDSFGLHECLRWCKDLQKRKVHYISYEIFFRSELNNNLELLNKNLTERYWFSFISSLVIQDESRHLSFCEEFDIKNDVKLFYVPYSPPQKHNLVIQSPKKKKGLSINHRFSGIASMEKFIHLGGVKKTFGSETFVELVESGLESNQLIVLHPYSKLDTSDSLIKKLLDLESKNYPIIFDSYILNNQNEIDEYLDDFKMGFAMYYPVFPATSIWNGKNLKTMGYASGKFATYMMNGIPAITTDIGRFRELSVQYDFGLVADNVEEIRQFIISREYTKINRDNCIKLYKDKLCPNKEMSRFVDFVSGK
jgi:glycosyltransferase involved in cell wall biosynthesis